MPEIGALLVLIVVCALAFDYINGFHDTANAIATVVSTRVLSPTSAIIMASVLNFVGAIVATHVAKTIAGDIVAAEFATQPVVLAALIGGITWNLITWRFGIPSSSSHALIGGLVGSSLAHAGSSTIKWAGLTEKVLIPLVASPMTGFFVGFLLMKALAVLVAHQHPAKVGKTFRSLQIFSAAAMAFAHGSNDAQKSMGIITLALFSSKMIPNSDVTLWVVLSCAIMMALGT